MTTTTRPESPVGTHALQIEAVEKVFDNGTRVLEDVSLRVAHGEFVAIVGPSGCGKTTLLRIIQGLDHVTGGSVSAHARGHESRPRMSYVFQRSSLLPWFSIRKNVSFGLTLRAGQQVYKTKTEREAAVDELLELTGLTQYADYYPAQISGGMQQRVNVARALAVKPDILLLDEPFSALDALTREKLQIDVAHILERLGATAVLVTHDIREAVFLSDRIAVMAAHPGHIREVVTVDQPRPRTEEFQHSPELASQERQIWSMLHGPADHSRS